MNNVSWAETQLTRLTFLQDFCRFNNKITDFPALLISPVNSGYVQYSRIKKIKFQFSFKRKTKTKTEKMMQISVCFSLCNPAAIVELQLNKTWHRSIWYHWSLSILHENQRFSNVFRGYRKRSVVLNGLIKLTSTSQNDCIKVIILRYPLKT